MKIVELSPSPSHPPSTSYSSARSSTEERGQSSPTTSASTAPRLHPSQPPPSRPLPAHLTHDMSDWDSFVRRFDNRAEDNDDPPSDPDFSEEGPPIDNLTLEDVQHPTEAADGAFDRLVRGEHGEENGEKEDERARDPIPEQDVWHRVTWSEGYWSNDDDDEEDEKTPEMKVTVEASLASSPVSPMVDGNLHNRPTSPSPALASPSSPSSRPRAQPPLCYPGTPPSSAGEEAEEQPSTFPPHLWLPFFPEDWHADRDPPYDIPQPRRASLLTIAEHQKERGNRAYRDGHFHLALRRYARALAWCPPDEPSRAVYFCNRAAVYMSLQQHDEARADCDAALALRPDYARILARRAAAREALEDLSGAQADWQRVAELDVGNRAARDAVHRLGPLVQAQQEKMKEEMMAQLKSLGNSILGTFGMSLDQFQLSPNPSGEGYSIQFGNNQPQQPT